jgi:hypothetical protein
MKRPDGTLDQFFPLFDITRIASIIAGVAIGLTSLAAAADPQASSFVLRNHSPFSAIIGIPGRWPDGTDDVAELTWNTSNHSMAEVENGEQILLDGETQTITLRAQHPITDNIQVGAEIPWINHSGGYLDSAIEGWHDLFGLPDGIRKSRPKNVLDYSYLQNGAVVYQRTQASSGFGDIRLGASIGPNIAAKPADRHYLQRINWRLKISAKLPTGDAGKLTGSGNFDPGAGLGISSPAEPGSSISWWLDAGLVWPGGIDIDQLDTASQVFYYDAAIAWRAFSRLDLILQIGGNTALYDVGIKNLGEPVAQLAIGAQWHASDKLGVKLGIFEDIRTESAPDFGIELSLILKSF